MELAFVAKDPDSEPSGSPTLYRTDRQSWMVQGWVVTDPDALAPWTSWKARHAWRSLID